MEQEYEFKTLFDCNCSSKIKGDIFEYICKYILLQTNDIVYLNNDIPTHIREEVGMGNVDKGIDIIYKNNSKYIAVQCKWRAKITEQLHPMYITYFRTVPKNLPKSRHNKTLKELLINYIK